MVTLRQRQQATLLVASGMLAVGCAVVEPAVMPPAGSAPEFATKWRSVRGGWWIDGRGSDAKAALQRLLVRPTAVVALGNHIGIVEEGGRRVIRYDRVRDTLHRIVDTSDRPLAPTARTILGIAAGPSFFLVGGGDGSVTHVDPSGKAEVTFELPAGALPVALAYDQAAEVLLVADAAARRIYAFSKSGGLHPLLLSGHMTELNSLTSLALGPDGTIYILDGVAQRVVVLGRDGTIVGSFGEDFLIAPTDLAVDHAGRAFVADAAVRMIHVFAGGARVARIMGSEQGVPFASIAALSVSDDILYVADEVAASVHMMLIAPMSMLGARPR